MKRIITLCIMLFVYCSSNAQIQQLQKLGQISFGTSCAGVWHYVDSTGHEYALSGNGDGLVIIDVDDPANPAVLHTVPAANSLWREVKTYGHYAYAGTEGGGGITVVDLSGLPGTYQSKIYDGDGAIAGQLNTSHTVQVYDDHLYIFGSNIGTVMCSLADPWNPEYVGSYQANYVHDGYVLNDTLYSSEIWAGQFSVVDVTDKANPVVLATQPTPGAFNHNGWFSDNRQYFYTTDEQPNTPVGVFDVSDLQDIQLVSTYVNDTMPGEEIHNVRVFNDYLLCPSYGSQLTIVDGARPENLIEIARYQTGGYLCWDASPYLPSGNIIATDMDGEFYVFAPYYVRACYLEGVVTDQVTGNPITGADVKILTTNKEVFSNTTGDYKTGYPTPGTFDVEFSKSGYLTKVMTGVVLTTGNLTVLDVQLEPFSVALNVIDNSTGSPIPFAKVKVQNPSTDVELVTDGGGILMLSSVSSGSYDITAGLWGYKSDCISVTLGTSGSFTIGLDPAIFDDFTFDFGWSSFSTAASGDWVRDEPVGTLFTITPANPELDVTNDCSDRCYITGNGGGTANNDDVDDGVVTLESPAFDLTGYSDPYLNYSRWFFEQFTSNPAADDTLFITMYNGSTSVDMEIVTGPSPTNSTWVPVSLRVLDFLSTSATMKIKVIVGDKVGTSNPLEAGFDRFEITEGPTALNAIPVAGTMQVFPNPVNEKFVISLNAGTGIGIADLVITDISGKTILNKKVDTKNQVEVDTRYWASGIYIIKLGNEKQSVSPVKINKQ